MGSGKIGDGNITASFGADLCLSGFTNIPNLLLVHYPKLGLTDFEVMVLIQILRLRQDGSYLAPTPTVLSQYMSADEGQIEACLRRLKEKRLLSIKKIWLEEDETISDQYCFDALFQELSGVWALEKQQLLLKTQKVLENGQTKGIKKVYKTFEKEFGRLLNPMEAQQIASWLEDYKFNPELILEALRRASLRGVLNCRYIDKILLDWHKHNLTSLELLTQHEQNQDRLTKLPKKNKSNATKGQRDNGPEDEDEFALLYLS